MVHHTGRVSIIGAGTLGGTIAYGLIMSSIAKEILLVDKSNNILQGQVLDLSEAAANTDIIIRAGTFKEAGQSSLIIVTADTEPIPGESRQNWLIRSRRLFLSIASSLSPVAKDVLILISSDPVDLYVQFFQNYFPHVSPNRIFGIGTTMATCRFNVWLAEMTYSKEITDAYCIGNQKYPIVVWDHAKVEDESISTIPILESERNTLETIVSEHRTILIKERKGKAWYGTAAMITRLAGALLNNAMPPQAIFQRTWVLSAHVPQFDSCISWPVVIYAGGIERMIELPLRNIESNKVRRVVESNYNDLHASMGGS